MRDPRIKLYSTLGGRLTISNREEKKTKRNISQNMSKKEFKKDGADNSTERLKR